MTPPAPIAPPPAPSLDAYEYTAAMLMERAGYTTVDTLRAHIEAGHLVPGVMKPGLGRKYFWKRTDVNSWLRKIGQTDKQFPRS